MTVTTFLIIMLLQIAVFVYLLYRSIILCDLKAMFFTLCWLVSILMILEAGFQTPIEKKQSVKTLEVTYYETL